MKTLSDLRTEAERILKKAECYKSCSDGSYESALDSWGFYKILQQIEELRESEKLQSK